MLLVYRQVLTKSTKKWHEPKRKNGEKWVPIKDSGSSLLNDKYDGSFRGAIIKMKDLLKKTGKWKCSISSTQTRFYRTYILVCRRITS